MNPFSPKFKTQEMVFDEAKFEKMLEFSTEQLNDAYSRMNFDSHLWTKGTRNEIDTIIELTGITETDTIIDLGCGQGRHSIELAKRGFCVTGIDASDVNIEKAKRNAADTNATFKVGDARKHVPGKDVDCIICLYDVVGSYRNREDNIEILKSIYNKLHKGGVAVISVMNMAYLSLRATNRGNVRKNPRLLLELPASDTMQRSGDMFNVKYQLLDEDNHLVYHKEQFEEDGMPSSEYIVADYRFTQKELADILQSLNFEILESRFVRAGHFDVPLDESDDNAKEILFVVRKK